jgi:hypothetical protein
MPFVQGLGEASGNRIWLKPASPRPAQGNPALWLKVAPLRLASRRSVTTRIAFDPRGDVEGAFVFASPSISVSDW